MADDGYRWRRHDDHGSQERIPGLGSIGHSVNEFHSGLRSVLSFAEPSRILAQPSPKAPVLAMHALYTTFAVPCVVTIPGL
jgi:hypothetical protein